MYYWLTLLLAGLVYLAICPAKALAQQVHGWQTTEVCHPCTPKAFVVGDSMNHVLAVRWNEKNILLFTTDAGTTWRKSETPDIWFTFRAGYDFSSYFSPGVFILFTGSSMIISTDSGRSWSHRSVMNPTYAGKMFSPETGYRIIFSGGGTHEVRLTTDGGWLFIDRVTEWGGYTSHAVILDSLRLWRLGDKVMFRSWDAGTSWDTVMPLDISVRTPEYYYLQRTSDTSRFYVIGGYPDSSDYLVTTDGGTTWKDMSPITGQRVYLIAEQTPEQLWLLVARDKAIPEKELYDRSRFRGKIADTLYYSNDAGITWQKDLTFVGDTIGEFQFHGPGRGYVVSVRDSTVKFSRYVPDAATVGGVEEKYTGRGMYLHPHPVSDHVQFYPRLGGACQVRILDALGRTVYARDMELEHFQPTKLTIPDHLPNGLYFLELVRGDARAGQRFILQR